MIDTSASPDDPPPRGVTGTAPGAPPVRTLVLDDDGFERARIARVARRAGLTLAIEEAATIEEMTRLIDDRQFDLALIDYNLTDGDGIDAIRAIRAHADHRRAAIIMVTGQGRGPLVASAFHHGCHDFIEKDEIAPDSFRAAVGTALARAEEAARDRGDPAWRDQLRAAFRDPGVRAEIRAAFSTGLRDGTTVAGAGLVQTGDDLVSGLLGPDTFDFDA